MKEFLKNYPVIDMSKAQLSMKDLYTRTEKEINDFLKTRKGLAYLRMKYPKLPLEEAIREYKSNAYASLKY